MILREDLQDMDFSEVSTGEQLAPVHPGEILLEDFLKPLGLSQNELARHLQISPRRINEIVLRKRAVTADTALRLGRYFGTTAEFWMNLQSQYNLEAARHTPGRRLVEDVAPLPGEPGWKSSYRSSSQRGGK